MNTSNSTFRLRRNLALVSRAQLSPLIRRHPLQMGASTPLARVATSFNARLWSSTWLDGLQMPPLTRYHE